MNRSSNMRNERYYRGQQVEVRVEARNGRPEYWRSAKVGDTTSRGCYVFFADGQQGQRCHVVFTDLRLPTEAAAALVKPARFGTAVMTQEQVAEINRKALNPRLAQERIEPGPKPALAVVHAQTPEPLPVVIKPALPPHAERSKRLSRKHTLSVVASVLRNERLARGLTQVGAAEKLGVNDQRVSKLELGACDPTDEDLLAYHEHLGVDLAMLERARDARNFVEAPAPSAAAPAPKPAPEPEPAKPAPMEAKQPPAERTTNSVDDIAAFLDFAAKLQDLLPVPSREALPEYNRLAAALWRLR